MKLKEIDQFFWEKPEPLKSYLAALRYFVLHYKSEVTEVWSYSMPFYRYQGNRVCYIWINKKTSRPYLGIVNGNRLDHPDLVAEKRSRMKIFPLDPAQDLPIHTLSEILDQAISVC